MNERTPVPEDVAESELVTVRGPFRSVAFRDPVDGKKHLALVFGPLGDGENLLVRVHSECVTGDVFGALRCECGDQLETALDTIVAHGRGALVYLRGHEGRGIGLVNKARTIALQDSRGLDTVDSATELGLPVDARDYGPAARALDEYGVKVLGRDPLLAPARRENRACLTAKRDRLGHDLPHLDGPCG